MSIFDRLSVGDPWITPPPPHDYPYYWVILDPKSKEDKIKVINLKNLPKLQIVKIWNKHYTRHTFWSCLIRRANMKWIRRVLLMIQSGHDSVHRLTSLSMNKPTAWCKSGQVSLVSSSCLYKTQPERALAQVCHTRIDSPDEYQFFTFITSPKFPSLSSNISKVIESLTNLENQWEMFLEPSARMDIPSSDGRLSVWTNPQHDRRTDRRTDGRKRWNQYTPFQLRCLYKTEKPHGNM